MLKHYFWLLSLSGFALWQAFEIQHWPLGWQTLLTYAPYAVAGIGIFVSFLLNRMQPVFLLLSLLLVLFALNDPFSLFADMVFAGLLFPLVSVLLPVNIVLWSMMPERGTQHAFYNLMYAGVFVLQAGLAYWLLQEQPFILVKWLAMPLTTDLGFTMVLPVSSVVTLLVLVNVMLFRLAFQRRSRVFDQVALFVLLIMAVGLNGSAEYSVLSWMASIASLMVILSLVFDAHHIAYTDELTGMAGRRALFESFMGLGRKYSLAMIDIDHFKKFNDTYGHDVGDLVLRKVSQVLNKVGSGGRAYRFGGEEFTVVFAGKTPDQVRPVLDDLRKQVEAADLRFNHNGEETATKVTVSMGVAHRNAEAKSPEEVIKAADQALYQAKEAGRNRVVVSGDPAEKPIKKGSKSARVRKRKTAAK